MSEHHLRTDHLLRDLPSRSVRGGAVALGAQIGQLLLNLVTAVVLARLLTPGEFGIVAMAMLSESLFSGSGWPLFFINAGYRVFYVLLAGAILGGLQ